MGVEIHLINGQATDLPLNPEEIGQIPLTDDFPVIITDENGAVLFNLEWQKYLAESRRQSVTTAYGETYADPNQKNTTLNDLINLAKDHKDLKEFRRQTETFWRDVRQMSERKVIQENGSGGERETRTNSRFDKLLEKMESKKMSPSEFAQTLPPNERAVFKANHQLRQIFGANIFAADGVTLNEAGETRFREVLTETSRAAVSRENQAALKSSLLADAPVAVRGEFTSGDKNAALLNAKNNHAAQNPGGNAAYQNGADATNVLLQEGLTARNLTKAVSENVANNNAAVLLRDNGMLLGGALVGGAFSAIDNYQNSEHIKIGDSGSRADVSGENEKFAAGATGSMFGAAVGKIIPGAGTDVGGVLGFVSSVVTGVEVDQGFRWLSSGVTNFDTIGDGNGQNSSTGGNSFTSPLTLKPVSA